MMTATLPGLKEWKHDELAADLADHLSATSKPGLYGGSNRMIWLDVPVGTGGSQRPDVLTMEKSFTKPLPKVYEIKVSRSDFLADITEGKYLGYLKMCCGFYFAVPEGLVKRTEIPDGCGLLFRTATGWKTGKRVHIRPCEFPRDGYIRLLLRAHDEQRERQQRIAGISYIREKELKKKLGEGVTAYAHNIAGAERRLQEAKDDTEAVKDRVADIEEEARLRGVAKAEREGAGFRSVVGEAALDLGLALDATYREVSSALRKAVDAATATGLHRDGRMSLNTIARQARQIQEAAQGILEMHK